MASDGVSFSLIGMEALSNKLKTLDSEIKRKGIRFGLRKGANLVAKKAKEGALRIDDPNSASEISKNIAVRYSTKYFKATGNHKFRVGVLGGAGGRAKSSSLSSLPGQDTRHWRLQEFGTEHHRPQPFMRPALENNINEAINEVAVHTEKSIDRVLKRAKK